MESKKPHPSAWKIWILVVVTVQILTAIQNHCIHQQCAESCQLLWDSLIQQSQIVNGHLESSNQNLAERIRLEKELQESLRQILGAGRK